uniref:Uncharacterized protein n=1 Tax=Anguilla anguilla TaxID=7936 RepID=A0A0E9TXC0_ANGAN
MYTVNLSMTFANTNLRIRHD